MTPANTKVHTDIKSTGWVRHLPPAVRPYVLLMRLDRPVGIWLLLLPGLWGITLAAETARSPTGAGLQVHHAVLFGLFTIGAIIMRAAGCIINDLWDRRMDAAVARTAARPLASGAIRPRQALILLGLLLAIGFLILLQLPNTTIALGILSIPFIVAYPLMKRITWWPQLFLGFTFNFGALMGWSAVTGSISLPAILLYAGGIFWTLAYDTIYACQDIEDDMKIGIKSTAIRFGIHTRKWVTGFFVTSWVLIVLAFVSANASGLSLLLLLLPALHIFWQLRILNLGIPQSCLRVFKINRDFGLLVLLAALL